MSKKLIIILSMAVLIAMAVTAFPLHIEPSRNSDWPFVITIGSPISAQEADYTCDGTDDNVQFQTAINALPSDGGQLFVLAGNYTFADSTTVTRAIDHISIIGVSAAVSFTGDGITAIFTAGGDGWLFSNIEVDAGGLNMSATTDYMWLHVIVDSTYYPLKTDAINIEDHSTLHGVGAADTIFPADPNADKYLMWDDDPGQLSWEDGGGIGDMAKATYDTDEDGDIDTAAGGTEWDSSAATGIAYITAGAWGTRSTGISNTYVVIVDDADAANGDIPYFTTSGLAGYNEAEFKSAYNMEAGTDYQAQDAELQAIAGLTSAADKMIYFTGSGTADTSGLTAFARSILDDANEATFKATVNLEIGTDVQAWDTDLDDIAALSDADSNFIVGNGANWVVESGATVRQSLGLIIGTDVQAYDAELAALAGLTSAADKLPYFTGSETAGVADFTAYGRGLIAVADEAAFKLLTNLEIGTDVLAQQAIGIADDNLVEMDDADAADNDYAKFTANGLEGRSYSELVADIQNSLYLINDATDQDTLVEAEEDQVTMDVAGAEAFKLSSAGILTTIKQASAGAYRDTSDIKIKTSTNTLIPFNAESFDIQNEMTLVTESTATAGTMGTDLYDTSNPFVEGDVGKPVWNYADGGCTTIVTYENAGYVTLTADIDLDNTDAYGFGHPRFTATEDGVYAIAAQSTYTGLSDGKRIIVYIYVNGVAVSSSQAVIGGASSAGATTLGIIQLSATDYVEIWTYHNEGSADDLRNGSQWTYFQISKLA